MNKIINSKMLKNFNDNGYVSISPGTIFSFNEINNLINIFDKLVPEYKSGAIKPFEKKFREFNLDFNQFVDSRLKLSFTKNNIRYDGCARRHHFLMGCGSIEKNLDDNIYFGKRAVLADRFFNDSLVDFIEHNNIKESLSNLYRKNDLSFHNGSLAAVYPGCVGEPSQFHIDTPGFNQNRNDLINQEKFLINVFVFLSDISNEMAPMRVIPGSHKFYSVINNTLSKSFNKSNRLNNVPQAEGTLWEELLPNFLAKPVNLIGKKGTVILMRSDLLHSATENYSSSTRKVMILNYSKRSDVEFSKKIYHDSKNCKIFYKKFRDPLLAKATFYNSGNPPINFYLMSNIRKFFQFCKKNWRIPFRPIKRALKLIFIQNIPIERKEYLNIGSGPTWRHNNVIGLDYDKELSEVSFDLNAKKKLPFDNNRFKGIYTSHCLEHLKDELVFWWFSESYRVLKKGGVLRVTVPDIPQYLKAYDAKDASYFSWMQGYTVYRFMSWMRFIVWSFAAPVVEQFSDKQLNDLYAKYSHAEFLNFFTNQVKKIDDKRLLIPGCHKSWWSPEKMEKLMLEAGFSRVIYQKQRMSLCRIFTQKIFNNTCPSMSFYIEAIK